MKYTKHFLGILCLACLATTTIGQNPNIHRVWYVSQGGAGTHDGTSWADAAPDVASLPFETNDPPTLPLCVQNDDTIWIAHGTYPPIRIHCGDMKSPSGPSINIFGGFLGREKTLKERIGWYKYPTIINGGDTAPALWIEDSASVIAHRGCYGQINGLILENGATWGTGVRLVNTAHTLSDLIIRNNSGGATIYMESCGKDTIHVYEYYNEETGKWLYVHTGSVIFQNILMYGNTINSNTDAIIYAVNSKANFVNLTVANNDADLLLYSAIRSDLHVYNSIFWPNKMQQDVAIDNTSNIDVGNTIFEGSRGSNAWHSAATDRGSNLDIDPVFQYNYTLSPNSPAIGAADPIYYDTVLTTYPYTPIWFAQYDLMAQPRFTKYRLDMGAYQDHSSDQNFVIGNNCSNANDIDVYPTVLTKQNNVYIRIAEANLSDMYADVYTVNGLYIKSIPVFYGINCIEMPEVTGLYVLRLRTHNATIQTTKITVQ